MGPGGTSACVRRVDITLTTLQGGRTSARVVRPGLRPDAPLAHQGVSRGWHCLLPARRIAVHAVGSAPADRYRPGRRGSQPRCAMDRGPTTDSTLLVLSWASSRCSSPLVRCTLPGDGCRLIFTCLSAPFFGSGLAMIATGLFGSAAVILSIRQPATAGPAATGDAAAAFDAAV